MKTAGLDRVNLIQMSYYYPKKGRDESSKIDNGFNNDYLLHMATLHKEVCVGTAAIYPARKAPDRLMTEMAGKRGRAFRVYPGLERGLPPNARPRGAWLNADGYAVIVAAGATNTPAIS